MVIFSGETITQREDDLAGTSVGIAQAELCNSLEETLDSALGKQLSLKIDSRVGIIYRSRRYVKMRR